MVKALALNTVYVCKSPGKVNSEGKVTKKAEGDIRLPGAIFELDAKQFKEFEKIGAVRAATRADLAIAGIDDDGEKRVSEQALRDLTAANEALAAAEAELASAPDDAAKRAAQVKVDEARATVAALQPQK